MLRSWGPALALTAAGAAVGLATRTPWLTIAFLLLALVISPLVFPRSLTAAEAQRRSAADGRPIVYWRPGCVYCLRLRRRLGRAARKVHWVNIWNDPGAAAAVRQITGGDETVPTVVANGESVVNPDPDWLLARVR
jgi:mycoredoxin